MSGVPNLRLASHMRLFDGLFVALDKSKHPEFKKTAFRIISIFGTTYLCESFYSTLKFVKSKHRSVLTNQQLKELLRSAVTNYSTNFKEL